ncbi:MAG: hypothetical protein WA029_22435, partial [Anaerolineae bacterium]
LGVCSSLAAHHGPAFADAACAVKGRTRHYVASSADGMISPAQIPGTALWIETNQSAKSVVQVIGKLLAALGHAPDQFTVNRAMPPQIESRPVSTQNAEPYLHRDR